MYLIDAFVLLILYAISALFSFLVGHWEMIAVLLGGGFSGWLIAGLSYNGLVEEGYRRGVIDGAAQVERRWYDRIERAVTERLREKHARLGEAMYEPMTDKDGSTRAWREIIEDEIRNNLKISDLA
jgi:hypothetical protein